MKSEVRSQGNLRRRKMLLVLPLLVIPFLTMAFWALGGGKGSANPHPFPDSGLNLNLPNPKLKDDKLLDKLSFYDKADNDSIKLAEEMRNDPYYKVKRDTERAVPNELAALTQMNATKYNQKLNVSPFDKVNQAPDQMLMEKLSVLQRELNPNAVVSQPVIPVNDNTTSPLTDDVRQLKGMITTINTADTDNGDMHQISTIMDKILDVQHPERVKERMNEKAMQQAGNAFMVSGTPSDDTAIKGFYGMGAETLSDDGHTIEAIVHENQVLVNGAVIKLRLVHDIYINGTRIPAGNFIHGIVSLDGERLDVSIHSIRCNHDLFTVSMDLYDMDGLPGIYIPGAIGRDVLKQSADNSMQLLEMSSLDPSLKAQATAAGVGTLKNLLSKKVKMVKVMVKAGYKVLLKNKGTL